MKPREVIRILEREGWRWVSSKGSHFKYKKGNNTTIIAFHNEDLKPKTLAAIEKQTGIKLT